MGTGNQTHDAAMQSARLAMAAHMDALAAAQDAKSLRLDHVRSALQAALPETSAMRKQMLLRLPPENDARLLLDLTRSIVMTGDGRTYLLEEDAAESRHAVFETTSADALVGEVLRLDALATIEAAQKRDSNRDTTAGEPAGWAQEVWLFVTGMVFGASALAALAIYLKKINF